MPVSRKHPATYIASIGTFPQGPYQKGTPSEVYLAAGLARRLQEKMKGESIRYIAKKADLSPQTLVNILHGKTWPDLLTIARLENALEGKLWGNEHRKRPNWTHGGRRTPPGFEELSVREEYEMLLVSDPAAARKLARNYNSWWDAIERQREAKSETPNP